MLSRWHYHQPCWLLDYSPERERSFLASGSSLNGWGATLSPVIGKHRAPFCYESGFWNEAEQITMPQKQECRGSFKALKEKLRYWALWESSTFRTGKSMPMFYLHQLIRSADRILQGLWSLELDGSACLILPLPRPGTSTRLPDGSPPPQDTIG